MYFALKNCVCFTWELWHSNFSSKSTRATTPVNLPRILAGNYQTRCNFRAAARHRRKSFDHPNFNDAVLLWKIDLARRSWHTIACPPHCLLLQEYIIPPVYLYAGSLFASVKPFVYSNASSFCIRTRQNTFNGKREEKKVKEERK